MQVRNPFPPLRGPFLFFTPPLSPNRSGVVSLPCGKDSEGKKYRMATSSSPPNNVSVVVYFFFSWSPMLDSAPPTPFSARTSGVWFTRGAFDRSFVLQPWRGVHFSLHCGSELGSPPVRWFFPVRPGFFSSPLFQRGAFVLLAVIAYPPFCFLRT